MIRLNCPSCGASIEFKSKVTVFAVCSYCRMTIVRRDVDIETLGKMAVLPSDMSPLQIGTTGKFDKKNFDVIGRLKVGWEKGTWNEWYVLFHDGSAGWLAEAQGFWMMSFEVAIPELTATTKSIFAGGSVNLGGGRIFTVNDIKTVSCLGSEGELPKEAIAGRKGTSVDLSREDGQFATLEFGDAGLPLVFIGRYVEFSDFEFRNLREIDGW